MKGHRWFAAAYDLIERAGAARFRPVREFVAGGAKGETLEVGCGTGLNLPFFDWQSVTRLEATEPDPYMLRRAVARAVELDIADRVHFTEAPAEVLPFPDAIFDTVVVSLVLCTAADVPGALAEVKRVLKADGVMRIVEHVRGDGLLGKVQDVIEPVWGYFSAGCHPNRRTEQSLADAGFSLDAVKHISSGIGLPAFVGLARPRPGQPPGISMP